MLNLNVGDYTMLRVLKVFFVICGLAVAVGCGETDLGGEDETSESSDDSGTIASTASGSTAKDSQLNLNIQGSAPGAALVEPNVNVIGIDGSTVGVLSVESAQIVLDKIKIKMAETSGLALLVEEDGAEEGEKDEEEDGDDGDEGSSDSLEFKGPILVDLLTNTMSPEPPAINAPAGNYKHIELSVHKVEDEDAVIMGISEADPLFKNSIYLVGTYTPVGGEAVSFTMQYDLSEEFLLQGNGGMDVTKGANDIVIAFRMASWFDFSRLDSNGDGVTFSDLPAGEILLNKDSDDVAKSVQKVIKENIKDSADFGKDEDGDGELSEAEDSETEEEEE